MKENKLRSGEGKTVLYICNLVRPFTVNQLRELLLRTGRIVEDGFWIDSIKSKCYVQVSYIVNYFVVQAFVIWLKKKKNYFRTFFFSLKPRMKLLKQDMPYMESDGP